MTASETWASYVKKACGKESTCQAQCLPKSASDQGVPGINHIAMRVALLRVHR